MKVSSYRDRADDELRQVCQETSKELFSLKVKKGVGDTSEQPLRVRTLRRDLARIKTVLRERELKSDG